MHWNAIGTITSLYYIGEFYKNKRTGVGIIHYKNGDCYRGDFKENQRTGIGKLQFKNGDVYIGEFQINKRHGNGRYIFANGTYKEGKFDNDEYINNSKLDADFRNIAAIDAELSERVEKIISEHTRRYEEFDPSGYKPLNSDASSKKDSNARLGTEYVENDSQVKVLRMNLHRLLIWENCVQIYPLLYLLMIKKQK